MLKMKTIFLSYQSQKKQISVHLNQLGLIFKLESKFSLGSDFNILASKKVSWLLYTIVIWLKDRIFLSQTNTKKLRSVLLSRFWYCFGTEKTYLTAKLHQGGEPTSRPRVNNS